MPILDKNIKIVDEVHRVADLIFAKTLKAIIKKIITTDELSEMLIRGIFTGSEKTKNILLDVLLKLLQYGVLTGDAIREKMKTGEIVISPFNDKQVNPNSYNVTLSNKLVTYELGEDGYIDVRDKTKLESYKREIIIPETGLVVYPDEFYLGRTNEYTETYNLVPLIDGRSSMGRIGLSTNQAAGFGDIGFRGSWTVQISAKKRTKLYPNMEIAQLFWLTPIGKITNYAGKYNNNGTEIQTSKCYLDHKQNLNKLPEQVGMFDDGILMSFAEQIGMFKEGTLDLIPIEEGYAKQIGSLKNN